MQVFWGRIKRKKVESVSPASAQQIPRKIHLLMHYLFSRLQVYPVIFIDNNLRLQQPCVEPWKTTLCVVCWVCLKSKRPPKSDVLRLVIHRYLLVVSIPLWFRMHKQSEKLFMVFGRTLGAIPWRDIMHLMTFYLCLFQFSPPICYLFSKGKGVRVCNRIRKGKERERILGKGMNERWMRWGYSCFPGIMPTLCDPSTDVWSVCASFASSQDPSTHDTASVAEEEITDWGFHSKKLGMSCRLHVLLEKQQEKWKERSWTANSSLFPFSQHKLELWEGIIRLPKLPAACFPDTWFSGWCRLTWKPLGEFCVSDVCAGWDLVSSFSHLLLPLPLVVQLNRKEEDCNQIKQTALTHCPLHWKPLVFSNLNLATWVSRPTTELMIERRHHLKHSNRWIISPSLLLLRHGLLISDGAWSDFASKLFEKGNDDVTMVYGAGGS